MLQDGATTLLILSGALALELWLAAMPPVLQVLRHPLTAVDRAAVWLDRRLNRENRSERARRERGLVAVVLVTLAVASVGAAVGWFLALPRFGWAAELAIVAVLVDQRGSYTAVARVADALETEGLPSGQLAVLPFARRNPSSLDLHGVVRVAIEELAERFAANLVAPALWYALFGLAGLFFYVALMVVARRIAGRDERYRAFGWAASWLMTISLLAPAALAALLIATVSLASGGGLGAWQALRRLRGKGVAGPALWPVAAAAGGLGLALAGPASGRREVWIGDGRARATPSDLRRALALYIGAAALHAAFWLALFVALRA
jgi:adenosylcobinamide-phosphate synthase